MPRWICRWGPKCHKGGTYFLLFSLFLNTFQVPQINVWSTTCGTCAIIRGSMVYTLWNTHLRCEFWKKKKKHVHQKSSFRQCDLLYGGWGFNYSDNQRGKVTPWKAQKRFQLSPPNWHNFTLKTPTPILTLPSKKNLYRPHCIEGVFWGIQLVPIKTLQSLHAKFRATNESFEANFDCTIITRD